MNDRMTLSLFLGNAAAVLAMMSLLWLWSVYRRDVSIVDPWWSMGFLLVAVRTYLESPVAPHKTLLLTLVAVWALRLWLHLLWRARGKPEDPRYQAFRARYGAERYWWVSFFQVFVLQGVLALIISLPLSVTLAQPSSPPGLSPCAVIGGALFAIGFLCEAVADWQLGRHRADPARRGTVLDSGLWRYSRHPNYFGEALLWWGLWLFGVDLQIPATLWTVLSPVLLTFLLLRVSGVTLLEAQLSQTKPGYRAYVESTSAFIPLPPRRRGARPTQGEPNQP